MGLADKHCSHATHAIFIWEMCTRSSTVSFLSSETVSSSTFDARDAIKILCVCVCVILLMLMVVVAALEFF